jgi:hypothetical protein
MSRFVGSVELGSLRRDDQPCARPVRPWLIDLSMLKPQLPAVPGDLADFSSAPDIGRWRLGDTPSDAAFSLRWNEIEDCGRRLLVCDRMIMARISWDDLDGAGYVRGRPVTIDGRAFSCRLLTGGMDFRVAGDGYQGGAPANEWDRIIGGDEAIDGLPAPIARDAGRDLTEDDLASDHNRQWNWFGAVSWTQEPYIHLAPKRCCRGYQSARFFYLNTNSHRHEDIGWRPVLEPA